MRSWRRLVSIIGDALRGRRLDTDIDDELRFHVDAEVEAGLRAGLPFDEAERLARAAVGGPAARVRELIRDARGVSVMDDFRRDLVHGARLIRRAPGFSAVVVLIMAAALGVLVAAFSLADGWLFRPLAFPAADRLVVAFGAAPQRPTEPAVWLPYRVYLSWSEHAQSFDRVAGAFFRGATFATATEARSVVGMRVTPEFFDTLGVAPLLGRTLGASDDSGPRRIVLSYGFWQRHLGGARDTIGSSLILSDESFEVVGVMPRDFDVRLLDRPEGAEFFMPLRRDERGYQADGVGPVAILARLKSGVPAASAQAEVAAITRQSESPYASNFNQFVVNLASLQADNTRTIRSTLLAMAGAAALLLLVAATNVGALMLGRGLERRPETALRVALGAGRGRLVRQFLTEGLLLSVLGAAGGLVIANLAVRAFVAWNPLGTLPANGIPLDLRMFAIAGVATAVTTAVSGLLPALRASSAHQVDALNAGASRTATGRTRRTQSVLLAFQMGVSVVVIAASVLLARTFLRLQGEPLGFDAKDLSVATVVLPTAAFGTPESRHPVFLQLAEALRAWPGVRAVAASTSPPLVSGPPVTLHRAAIDDATDPRVSAQDVSAGFFDAMAIPTLVGRTFDAGDSKASVPAVVVNARAARMFFGGVDTAVGQRVRLDDESWSEVVGVVANVRSSFFNTLEWKTDPIVYRPAAQRFGTTVPAADSFSFELHVRADGRLTGADLRRAVAAAGPRAVVTSVRRGSDFVAEATRQPAFRMTLLLAFAAACLGLAAIGIYGLVRQTVLQRLPEIAIRLALGARRGPVIASVARSAVLVGLAGLGLGAIGAVWAGRAWESMLYGVRGADATSVILSGIALLSIVGVAAVVPAWRASRIDPVHFLKGS